MTGFDRIKESTDLLLRHAEFQPSSDVLVLSNDPAASEAAVKNGLAQENSAQPHIESMLLSDLVRDQKQLDGRRWAVICVIDPQLEAEELNVFLARIRDLHADRVLHISESVDWPLANSLALGFWQRETSELFSLFEFNLHSYKPVPNWLNSRHWANPERWGKHRW